MGHTLTEWRVKVQRHLRDTSGRDWDVATVEEVGIRPAIAQFSIDRPRIVVAESSGAGSAYFSLPSGWTSDFSELRWVEYPARNDPPVFLDEQSFTVIRSNADTTVEQILLNRSAALGTYVRFHFTAPWPYPTATAGDDKISDYAYEAVTQLAAAFCLESMVNEAARDRGGSIPANVVEGGNRSRTLLEAAKRKRALYESFIGLGAGVNGGSDSPSSVAHGRFDFDPGRSSLFHGGRR